MGYVLSTTQMAAELVRRLPVGLTSAMQTAALNTAYLWLCQRGPMSWLLTSATVSVAPVTGVFDLPVGYADTSNGAGTVTISGTSVTGAGTAFAAADVGKAIRFQGDTVEYQIASVTSPTLLTLVSAATSGGPFYTYRIFGYPFDIGRPAALYGPAMNGSTAYGPSAEIPYKPWTTVAKQQNYGVTVTEGMYSVWTIRPKVATNQLRYQGVLFPTAASAATGGHTLTLIYHMKPSGLAIGGVYFPSPDVFDYSLVDLAEAEAKRIYGIAGWEIAQKRGEDSVMAVIDQYHSTKMSLAGVAEQARRLNETQVMKG